MQTGFIGLGAMGAPMAANLQQQQLLAAVWNRSAERAQAFSTKHQVRVAAGPADLWQDCAVVVLCVTADAQVLELVGQLAAPQAKGRLVIDASTVAAGTARTAAAMLAKVGARFLDAPVTGGTEGAHKGTLTFMVGGATADVAEAAPLFAAMGARHVHMGKTGAGQATKAVNQVACAGIAQGVTEAVAFAEAQGLPLDKVLEVVGSGAAGSWFMTHRGGNFIDDRYPIGFKVALHHKDLLICQQMAQELGGALPLTEKTIPQYAQLMQEGYGDEDISALYRSNRKLFSR